MPTKKTKVSADPDMETNVEKIQADPDQRFKVFILDFVNGKRRPCYIETIQGYDIDFIKERFGGGTFEIKPIDESEKFIKGGFSVTVAGAKIPLEKMPIGSEDIGEASSDDDSEPILDGGGSDAHMLRYLIDRTKELEAKLDQGRPSVIAGDGGMTTENISAVVDKLMEKQIVYSTMLPIIERMRGGDKRSETDPLQLFEMFTKMLKEGIKLGQGVDTPEHEDKGVLGVVEKFLPDLMKMLAPKPPPETEAKVPSLLPVETVGPTVAVGQAASGVSPVESDNMFRFDLPQRISQAISILISCLNADIDMPPEEIASEYVKKILSEDDIKVIGDNLSYEKICDLISDQGDLESKLVLRENEEKVKAVIGCLKGNSPSLAHHDDGGMEDVTS